MNITSAAGVISLLDEPASELKIFALQKLDAIVDEFWPEISEVIQKIEFLHEDKTFAQQSLAALVASKVYFHLGSFADSLQYALGASDLFDVTARNEYVEAIIAKCIDHYTKLSVEAAENPSSPSVIDVRLEAIVNRMFQRCLDDKQYKQALGLALETRRMDIFAKSIESSDNVNEMLSYAFQLAMSTIENRSFRSTILRCLIDLYRNLEVPDYVNMSQCFIFLDDPKSVAQLLEGLIQNNDEKNCLMAYQIAFDLYESATQQFLSSVLESLRQTAPIPSATHVIKAVHAAQSSTEKETVTPPIAVASTDVSTAQPVVEERSFDSLGPDDKYRQEVILKLTKVLSGEVSIELHLQFLIRSNHTDMLILKNTKEAIRASVCHTATVIANGFMHSGTTSDQFLRDNLEWLARATNWAKLSATASLGVIHRGHETDTLELMRSYLPPRENNSSGSSGYSEGGGLYALGLIHANHGAAINDYLLGQLKDAHNEIVKHGGCLGIGLSAMGTSREDIYEQLKFNMYQDDAVTGEAAGLAMGLVMLGSKNGEALQDMVAYAQVTQHEKILRGLAVGISLVMYGRLEEADSLITSLLQDKDPILRRSAMYTISMAYCGTGSNMAIKKLLHVAVSDVNDDVRRAAVTGLGFLLFRIPEQCPQVVSLLAESYNPHVRYGAAMALGIACAGTGLKEAINLLELMTNDPVNYVRQGALIASAMILIQQTESICPKVKEFRTLYAKVITDKHEDVMAKFGAILAQGIIDGGGRNVSISLESRTGHTNMLAVVGLLLFTQYWYWFPLAHCLALAFTPTCIIALNAQLKMPLLELKSNAKPSLYAYPAAMEEKKREEREKVTTAVLSIAARTKRRKGGSVKATEPSTSEKMEIDEKEASTSEKMEIDEKEASTSKKKDEKKEEQKPEPNFEILNNPARIMKQQLKHLQLVENSLYQPLKDVSIGGIIVTRFTKNGVEDEQLVEPVAAFKPEDDKEPEAPEPFEYTDD